jgi:MraZ protein
MDMMFRGINHINLDPKGRVAIPMRYRDRLQLDCKNQLIATIDPEASCLLIYPMPEWEIIEQKIQALPSFNKATRRIQRLLIGHATELEIDNQGRILLPQSLREYAKLNKTLVLVGQGKKFELWDETTWHKQRDTWLAEENAKGDEIPEALQDLAL